MKTTNKFLVCFLALTAVFSAIFAGVTAFKLNAIKQTSNEAISKIIVNIKEQNPQISNDEIAKIINGRANGENIDSLLREYGIDADKDWIIYENETNSLNLIVCSAALCAVVCLSLTAVFLLYSAKQKKQTAEITACINRINKGDYDLSVKGNTEDKLSALKSEIYTTTVMLKEQSENSVADKLKLKDSLSDISHQLKTPLTSIMVMLDSIIDDENMPAKIRMDFLKDIRRETNNISFLVQSILTLSKLEADSIKFHSKPENIQKIFDECIKKNAVLAEIKNVNVTAECNESCEVFCDFKWLCEAVSNILKNCIEHTAENGYVRLSADKNKLYTKIVISDNGCGIHPDDLPHIFERFYKGKNSDENCVGIGLALAKEIVEKNGGYIKVGSQLFKGSTFEIKFFLVNA